MAKGKKNNFKQNRITELKKRKQVQILLFKISSEFKKKLLKFFFSFLIFQKKIHFKALKMIEQIEASL